jgi:hypothetical protein
LFKQQFKGTVYTRHYGGVFSKYDLTAWKNSASSPPRADRFDANSDPLFGDEQRGAFGARHP